jgi:hypothetical protein
MSLRVIFLDIDGVLVNQRSLAHASGMRAKADAGCVAVLNHIVARTNASIVVSSTWRMGGLHFVKKTLRLWGVSGRVIDRTPQLRSVERGEEIAAWLSDVTDIESFVILDDDDDMLHLSGNLVQTEFAKGLTVQDAERAIAILERVR